MRVRAERASVFAFALVALCVAHSPAPAQLMSKWGHPVFTIGATPYDSVNQGHGNYPGGPGFIPGYGYYPGPGPGTYPWMDGPGTPFDRRKLAGPAPGVPPGETAPRWAGIVVVQIPDEAELWIDDRTTEQGGSYRRFITPDLSPGEARLYRLRVVWRIKGYELTRSALVSVSAGAVASVNFLTVEGWTGRRLDADPVEVLPEPRRAVGPNP